MNQNTIKWRNVMNVVSKMLVIFAVVTISTACSFTSARDKCADAQGHLWTPGFATNEYKGNERYWDAITQCDNKG